MCKNSSQIISSTSLEEYILLYKHYLLNESYLNYFPTVVQRSFWLRLLYPERLNARTTRYVRTRSTNGYLRSVPS